MVAFPVGVPVLSDPRAQGSTLQLRPHRGEDIERLLVASNDAAAQEFLNLPRPYTSESAREFIAMVAARWENDDSGYHSWAIVADGQYVGNVSVKRKAADAVEIGYLLHPAARGAGVATRAAELALTHAAQVWNPSVFHWRAAVGNWASRAVGWKLGFEIDGTYPCSNINAYGHPVAEWFGHRAVDAPASPTRPWWLPVPLETDDVWLAADRDQRPDWSERMANGNGVLWAYGETANRTPQGRIWVCASGSTPLEHDGNVAIAPARDDRGPSLSALDLVVRHALAPRHDYRGRSGLGLHRLTASVDVADQRTAEILLRVGFAPWGQSSQEYLQASGQTRDRIHFELVGATAGAV